jgi:hypothetical protein
VVVDISSKSERVVSQTLKDFPLGLAWLTAESLVLNQSTEGGGPSQLWRIRFPDGRLSRLTNDLARYVGLSLTANRGTLVSAQYATNSGIWVADGNAGSGEEVLALPGTRGARAIVSWAANRLLYGTTEGPS